MSLILTLVSCTNTNMPGNTTNDNNKEQSNEKQNQNEDEKKDEEKDNKKEENKDNVDDNSSGKKEESPQEKLDIKLESMIPKTNLELNFKGTDFASEKDVIKVKGNTYQVIESTGKGPVIKLYTVKDGALIKVYSGDLTEDESKDISKVDYIDKVKENEKSILLKEPLKLKTRWDNKEIVEVGKNLKLKNLQLEGTYIKTWEKTVNGNDKTIKVVYYSEGLGCVMYKVMLNDQVVEESELSSIVKK